MTLAQAEKVAREFFAGWAGPDPLQVFEDYLADDCTWLNTGLPTMEGKAACLALVQPFFDHFPTVVIDIVNIASNDEVVFVQRTDRLIDPNGVEAFVIEVTGVLRFEGNQIVHWHDYFDPTPFGALVGG
jgi:limonene-1,2-epoxide hydrolase